MREHNTEPFNLDAAVEDFMSRNIGGDHILLHADMWELLGLIPPTDEDLMGWGQSQRLEFVGRCGKLRDQLLREHKVDLCNLPGKGYSVVPLEDRVSTALEDNRKKMQKSINKASKRMLYIDVSLLTAEQRRAQLDALAKVDTLRAQARKPRR